MNDYKGQCFCYPAKKNGECEHCSRARMYIDREVYTIANELGEGIWNEPEGFDCIENLYELKCPECGETLEPDDDVLVNCIYCPKTEIVVNECDSEPQEVYQWYIVSDWIYRQLRDIGCVVAEWKGQYWWGRTCCGQSMEMDGTFQRISKELNND